MMAWGVDCSAWDDAVDHANLEVYDYEDIPDDRFVMTTWHDEERLEDVFRFCKHTAVHPDVEIENTVILHVGSEYRETEFLSMYFEV